MAMVPQGQEEEGLRELTLEELAGHHLILSKRHRKYVLSIFEKHGLSCDVYYDRRKGTDHRCAAGLEK